MYFDVILPFLILSLGIFLAVKIRFSPLAHPINTIRSALSGNNTGEAFISLMLALAGTLGVGNIVGVASAIAVGGAGSVFWMMLSAIFSSIIKYCEVMLSAYSGGSGMMGVFKGLFTKHGRYLAAAYAALGLMLSLTMGCVLQAGAIKGAADAIGTSGSPIILSATLIATLGICAFGKSGIRKAVALTVPFAAITYTGMCLSVIIPNLSYVPELMGYIIASAANPASASGGILGYLTSAAMREGFSAGLLSNEAGAGTSSLAHDSFSPADAARAGCFGIFEVIIDTAIICPMTAFAILLGGADAEEGITALGRLFARYFPFGDTALLVSVLAFALSTVICWYYYGSIFRAYLFGRKLSEVYFCAFTCCLAIGLFRDAGWSMGISRLILTAMTVLTSLALLRGADKLCGVKQERVSRKEASPQGRKECGQARPRI